MSPDTVTHTCSQTRPASGATKTTTISTASSSVSPNIPPTLHLHPLTDEVYFFDRNISAKYGTERNGEGCKWPKRNPNTILRLEWHAPWGHYSRHLFILPVAEKYEADTSLALNKDGNAMDVCN
jgi:hypothetical protein